MWADTHNNFKIVIRASSFLCVVNWVVRLRMFNIDQKYLPRSWGGHHGEVVWDARYHYAGFSSNSIIKREFFIEREVTVSHLYLSPFSDSKIYIIHRPHELSSEHFFNFNCLKHKSNLLKGSLAKLFRAGMSCEIRSL